MLFGMGVLRGMAVTMRNFFASYFRKPEEGGLFTVEYPEQRLPVKERFRNFPFLVYDKNPENMRCVACDICAKECPPKCIYIVRDKDEAGRPLKRPAIFDIDFTVCMNCGICEEACPFDAIYMDHHFEIADADRQKALLYNLPDLLKPNEYFHKIRPNDASQIDARRLEAEKKKIAAAQTVKTAAVKPRQAADKSTPPPPAANPANPE